MAITCSGKISAIIIAFNSQKFIEDCIKSLEWVDEIILIDLGSTDNTIEKASHYGAKIVQHSWVPFADPVRDYGTSLASGDWILHIDPDERVSPKLARLLQLIANNSVSDRCSAVRIPRQNIAFGKAVYCGGLWPDWQVRFGRRNEISFTGEIHETGQAGQNSVTNLEPDPENAIVHLSVFSISQLVERLGRYSESHAKQLYKEGKRFTAGSLIADPLYDFYKNYIELQGYRDGIVGLILALSWHFLYPLMIQLHLWELSDRPGLSAADVQSQSALRLVLLLLGFREIRNVVAYILRREIPGTRIVLKAAVTLRRYLHT